VKGYLLDTNHVSAWKSKHPKFIERVRSLAATDLPRVCAITLGEIEAGNQMTITNNQAARDEFNAFVVSTLHPFALDVTLTTRTYYGNLMGRIWKAHPPANSKTKTEAHLAALGVDINDVWIAAVAWEHGMVLLTGDSMSVIKQVLPEVAFENWLT
jgi:tRNA(fMet)-specific endonuclease VapC